MLSFFRPNRKLPPFEELKSYSKKDFYFRRIASWSWLDDDNIFILDPNASRFITLDPWPQKIFLEASGQISIYDYIYEITKEYTRKIPEMLDKTVLNEIQTLLNEGLIELCKKPKSPNVQSDTARNFDVK